jgi:uncharacterized membrane protein
MSEKIINIILILIVISLLAMDGLVIYDMLMEVTDLLYEIGMILVSIVVFIAIFIYLKQRKQKNTQFE